MGAIIEETPKLCGTIAVWDYFLERSYRAFWVKPVHSEAAKSIRDMEPWAERSESGLYDPLCESLLLNASGIL